MDKQSPVWTRERIEKAMKEYARSDDEYGMGALEVEVAVAVDVALEMQRAWQADHDALEDKAAASYQSGMSDERAHQNALSEMVKRAHQEEVDALRAELTRLRTQLAEAQQWEDVPDGVYTVDGFAPGYTHTLTVSGDTLMSWSNDVANMYADDSPMRTEEIGLPDNWRIQRRKEAHDEA